MSIAQALKDSIVDSTQAMMAPHGVSIMPDRNPIDELERDLNSVELTDDDIEFRRERAANRAIKLGDHIALISEAVGECSDHNKFDRIQDALLRNDDAELGTLFRSIIKTYAADVAAANGNF